MLLTSVYPSAGWISSAAEQKKEKEKGACSPEVIEI